jgi:hypothetical protein
MALARRVEAEVLDNLPADDPRAIRARRDLRHLNVIMSQADIMARALIEKFKATPRRIVDLGAGDGTFTLALARKLAARWPALETVMVDQADVVSADTHAGFAALGYTLRPVADDIFEFMRTAPEADIYAANLFIHHFEPPQLRQLFSAIAARAKLFIACEPRRARFPLIASSLVGLIGAQSVVRNDAPASIRAGFAGMELTTLWPDPTHWYLEERPARLFTHLFVARREEAP